MARGKKKGAGKGDVGSTPPSGSPGASLPIGGAGGFVEERQPSGAMVSHAPTNYRQGVLDVLVEKLDISYQGANVLENATLSLSMGHRYGLVGVNGCGKSTLMNVLGSGEIDIPPKCDYYHLKHEVASSEMSALNAVIAADREKEYLEKEMEELATMGDEEDHVVTRMDEIYARLDELDADTAEARAGRILFGLGFTPEMQARPTSSFSGGWRMRISLAQALFRNPTLLLLDEPTNHLDIEAVVWLENYLKNFKKILFMVSHSQDFMNEVCTNIMHMNKGKLTVYEGNYDMYCIVREEKDIHQMKRFEWQQAQIRNMKEYIARFGHGHKKLARQAQSKEKTLAKMTRGGLEQSVAKDRNVTFYFPSGGYLPPPMIQFKEVSFAYPDCKLLFRNLDLGVNMDSRICLVGPNGAGKTTLTKLMCRELEATEGYVAKNAHCTIARFHQHFVDQINMELTPLQWMQSEFPECITPEPLRSALGRFGISGRLQMSPMRTLSDGQKSRVVFAWIGFRSPHLMILDEPTNHLDMESIDGLAEAINEFEGAVVVVSHDMRLLAQIAEEIWIVDKGHAQKFSGDIADYKEFVQQEIARMESEYLAGKGK